MDLKKSFRRRKVTYVLIALATCLLVPLLRGTEDPSVSPVEGTIKDDDIMGHVFTPTTRENMYDVLLNSYMRSGSSFTARLLSFSKDVFYWYEPLWNYDSSAFYWGNDKKCYDSGSCSKVTPWSPHNMRHPKSLQLVLEQMYKCDFSTLVPAVAEGMTDIRSGESWAEYRSCRNFSRSVAACLRDLQSVCLRAKHRITKVLRLTLDNLEDVLNKSPKVKVIHLFRDPRGIINSRLTTNWYTLQESPSTSHHTIWTNAKMLCDRMIFDFRAGLNLRQKYPDRFAFVFYEDLLEDMRSQGKLLYSYVGIDPVLLDNTLENIDLPLEGVALMNKNSKSASWWRSRLNYDVIKVIDSACLDAYTLLGYKQMNATALNSTSIPSYSFRDEFRIKSIRKNLHYQTNNFNTN